MQKLKILGFAGSLRVSSYNKTLLRVPPAAELIPDDTTLEIFDLNGIPPFKTT
jgi:chromate reductase, NAD(P)H dehydrogenase (quinone)